MTLKELLGEAYKDGMTLDDVDTALAGVDLNTNGKEIERLKNAVSKANSEAAEYKRQLREANGNVANVESTWQTKYQDLEQRFAAIERERNIGSHKNKFLELGYEGDLAESTAAAMVDGDLETVFKNQRTFLEAHDKKVLQDTLRATPRPNSAQTGSAPLDYGKQIDEAMINGDMARAAALMRLQNEQT